MSTARRRATYQDVVEAPEHLVAELIDGELITSPRPASPHALAASAMSMDLSPFHQPPGAAGKPGGWWILYEPELHFGDDVLVPDLAGWRREHMPEFPNVAWFAQAPDWACEALSASTRSLDHDRKMPIAPAAHPGLSAAASTRPIASTSSRTCAADVWSAFRSPSVSAISITRSTPPAPIWTGTPT